MKLSADHRIKDVVEFILSSFGSRFHIGAVGDDILEHFLDNTLRGQIAGLCAGAVLKADGMAFINGSLDHIHAVGVFLDGVVVQVIGVGGDVFQRGQHANGDGVNEFNVVVRIIQVLDKGLADFGVLGVLPDDQRNVGGFGAVDGVAVGHAGQRSAADILGDLRGVVLQHRRS